MDAAAVNLPAPLSLQPLPAEPSRVPIGSLLVRDGLLTTEQLEYALAEKEQSGRRLGEILVAHGWVDPGALARLLAEQHGLEYIDLNRKKIDPTAASLLPEKYARRYDALPVEFVSQDLVLVAVADPTNVVASDDLRLALGLNVRLAVASTSAIAGAITRIYRTEIHVEAYEDDVEPDPAFGREEINEGASTTAPAIKLVNSLVSRAIDDGASDLHFEPQAKEMTVRARIDGVMRHLTTIPRNLQPAVTSRLKIMGELDIAERRAPQDGRVSIRYDGTPMDLRIAVLPTTHGEQIVLRIMQPARRPARARGAGDEPGCPGGLRPRDPAAVRRGARRRADRLREDDHALRRARHPQRGRARADDDRGPGRVPDARDQPDRGEPAQRPHLRARAAHDPPLRPGRAARRRDP